MKVLFLVSSMEGGGAERVASLLCNAWVAHGFQITLMPTFSGRGGSDYSLANGIVVEYLADHVNGAHSKIRRLMALRRFIQRDQPDIIISFLPIVNIAALAATIGVDIPVVACERIYPPLLSPPIPRSHRMLRDLLYPSAAILGAQTEGTADWLRGKYPRVKVDIIPNPVVFPLPSAEPALLPDTILLPQRKLLLGAGRLDPQKRPNLLIDAFSNCAAAFPDWDLMILGQGPQREALESQVIRKGLSDRIYLPGFAGNLADWYKRADVYVMTSAYEGFPNTLLEAMAHELPSVVFDIKTGPREITDGGHRAMLLPDDDHENRLTGALQELFADADKRKALGQRASEVREQYALGNVLAAWNDTFSSILDRSN